MLFVFIIIGLGVQETLLSFSGVIVLVIFLAIIYRIVRIGRTSVDLELEKKRLRSFADLPDSYHVFQGAYVEFEGRSYSCDYFVISPSCCFAIMEERSPGRFEGNTDFDIWTIINEEKGREVKKEVYFATSILRQQTYHAAEMLKSEAMAMWVQGIVYFSNKHASAKGTGKNTKVIDDKQKLHQYITSFSPPFKPNPGSFEKAIKLIKKRSKAKRLL